MATHSRRIFFIVQSWSESVDPKFPLRRLCALQFGLRTIFGRVMFPIAHHLQNQGHVLIVEYGFTYAFDPLAMTDAPLSMACTL